MKRALYLVAYDIRHPKRLQKTLYILKDYACAGQKSVFECWLSKREKQTLEKRLNAQININEDSVMFSKLRKEEAVRTLGIAPIPENTPFVYFG